MISCYLESQGGNYREYLTSVYVCVCEGINKRRKGKILVTYEYNCYEYTCEYNIGTTHEPRLLVFIALLPALLPAIVGTRHVCVCASLVDSQEYWKAV